MKVTNGVLLLQIFCFFGKSSTDAGSVSKSSFSLYNPSISYSRYRQNNLYSVYNGLGGYNNNKGYFSRGYYNRGNNRLLQGGLIGLLGILGGSGYYGGYGSRYGGYGGYNGFGSAFSPYGSGISTNIYGGDSIINHNHHSNNYQHDHHSNFFDGSDSHGSVGEGHSEAHDDGLSNGDSNSAGNDNEAAGDTGDIGGDADFGDGGDADFGDGGDADFSDGGDADFGDSGDAGE